MPVWDVGALPPHDQFGYWREVICEAFVPLAPRAAGEGQGFASRVEVRPLTALNCAVISSRAQHTAHGPAEVRRTPAGYYFVNLQVAGTCAVRHLGHESVVEPGWFTVVDTTEPYYFDFPRDWRMVSFRVPRADLATRLPDAVGALGVAVNARTGPGRVVAALMGSLWELAETPGAGSRQWAESFSAATAAALGPGADLEPPDLRRVIERHVRANVSDRTLSVRTVAARFGISPRTLHALFAGEEETFGQMVRRARLRRCAELLADPACARTVGEVGAHHGWHDPASFARAFRREFGMTPGEVRRSRTAPVQFVHRG